ncbi:adhesion G-protein coupled receptor G7 [Rhynchocyon petersi]
MVQDQSFLHVFRGFVGLLESYPSPPNPTIEFCKNGGTWENGRCICTDQWKGLRCTIVNFCEKSKTDGFNFERIAVGKYGPSKEKCEHNTANEGYPKATRLCKIEGYEIKLEGPEPINCSTNLKTLENQILNNPEDLINISRDAQLLTSDAEQLKAGDIASATKVVAEIFNISRNASSKAKETAVTTVSQLLDAKNEYFEQAATDGNNFNTLIKEIESYTLSLNTGIVKPNIAIQPGDFTNTGTGPSSVLFSVKKGHSNSLNDELTSITDGKNNLTLNQQNDLEILLTTQNKNITKYGFVVYQNSKFFQSKTFKSNFDFSQKIVASKTEGTDKDKQGTEEDKNVSVTMIFSPQYSHINVQLRSYACVFWNLSNNDWDTHGCEKTEIKGDFLGCRCNHTTNFAVLMSFQKNYEYPESLNILSQVGCALSITGLALTIVFQLATRRVRKTSVTLVLVNLCASMLIFNLLFVFGIENTNKNLNTNTSDDNKNEILHSDRVNISNPQCTAIAALLHYFLLVTFTWTGLSSAQLYYLLIWTMKPLPRHFILFICLIGWGVPAIVVGMTVGIIYSQNPTGWELDYRQEEICWLGFQDNTNFIKSTMLWSFYVPVTIILISNIIIFIIITVKVLWKNNQNLTSTKKVSSMKKILSTLSIAVVFGITWILAYFMLIDNKNTNLIFSYTFCLFNTTQGLQIFIFYTVKTKIFQREASKVLKSLSSAAGRMKPSVSQVRLRLRMYNLLRSFPALNERFRLLEPSDFTEELSVSEIQFALPTISHSVRKAGTLPLTQPRSTPVPGLPLLRMRSVLAR